MDDGDVHTSERGRSLVTEEKDNDLNMAAPPTEDTPKQQTKKIDFTRRSAVMSAQDGQTSSVWLVSFTDVIALMLTFFVLLYAMSDPVQQKWDYKMGMTVEGAAEYSGGAGNAGANEGENINRIDYRAAQNLDYVEAIFQELLKNAGADDLITIKRSAVDLRLSFTQKILDVETDAGVRSLVKRLAPLLNNLNNNLTLVATLPSADNAGRLFTDLQNVGAMLKRYGYDKPVVVALHGDIDVPPGNMDILVKPHDGRRITR